MDLHGRLLHSSAPCCSAVAVIARSPPAPGVQSHLKTAASACSMTTRYVCVLPKLSAKHFAEFPFWLLPATFSVAFLSCVKSVTFLTVHVQRGSSYCIEKFEIQSETEVKVSA